MENKKIVQLSDYQPHITGTAVCIACGNEWSAISEIGTAWLECPKCSCMKGRYKHEVLRDELEHWRCGCGNELFYVTPHGNYCPNCGKWQAADE